jgi:pyruvate-ferredoxin/flavodoxin oxidoreductase
VAAEHAPTPELQTRMMGIGSSARSSVVVDRIVQDTSLDALREKVYLQISKKFGRKGTAIVSSNMAVIEDGLTAVIPVPYDEPAYLTIDAESAPVNSRGLALSSAMCPAHALPPICSMRTTTSGSWASRSVTERWVVRGLPGSGLFVPSGTAAGKDKGNVPAHRADLRCLAVHGLYGVHPGMPGRRDPQCRAPRDPYAHRAAVEMIEGEPAATGRHARSHLRHRFSGA